LQGAGKKKVGKPVRRRGWCTGLFLFFFFFFIPLPIRPQWSIHRFSGRRAENFFSPYKFNWQEI
jgi:hypothetical protein